MNQLKTLFFFKRTKPPEIEDEGDPYWGIGIFALFLILVYVLLFLS